LRESQKFLKLEWVTSAGDSLVAWHTVPDLAESSGCPRPLRAGVGPLHRRIKGESASESIVCLHGPLYPRGSPSPVTPLGFRVGAPTGGACLWRSAKEEPVAPDQPWGGNPPWLVLTCSRGSHAEAAVGKRRREARVALVILWSESCSAPARMGGVVLHPPLVELLIGGASLSAIVVPCRGSVVWPRSGLTPLRVIGRGIRAPAKPML